MKKYTIDEVTEFISRIHSDETITLQLYTVDEVSKILKLTRITVYNYIKKNKLKAAKIGNAYRIIETDLLDFVQKSIQKADNKKAYN
ncbi:Helix-turn-helix domain protein [Pelotomaculum sp. FP]|uniref:helix-turn-helix domain-containing protein n=1 Tax=Pelotomaculum sp. FP TaxID=261474 RepID=UPI0011001414|nr:helix-turn-helix domain-containing protein [Pelotomaculum sp. FP]TEB18030.1 Helix-turn-helix domain protein [Pelotomaculum sp. FP]